MRRFITKKKLIKEFAKEIAGLQQSADRWFYIHKNRDHASYLLDQCGAIREFAIKLGICEKVYEEAYKIYDFRNSGRSGYTLKDGIVVKEELSAELKGSNNESDM